MNYALTPPLLGTRVRLDPLTLDQAPELAEAVAVDDLGRPTVRLSAAAIKAPAAELASRIVRLHTLACLRAQRARRGDGQAGLTEAQVSTYAATIDF